MRINRYLAAAGLGSRRACEALVEEGRVTINGQKVTSLATTVAPGDTVKCGSRILKAQMAVTLVLNKPKGIITTCADPGKRRTVVDLLPPGFGRVFPVGRLDMESEGLLVLTNDGALAQELMHPSHGVEKEYEVTLDKEFDPAFAPKMVQGFMIEGGRARAEQVYRLGKRKLKIVLKQGIKRQIRLMLFQLGYEVQTLRRVRIGNLRLGNMRAGEYRLLKKAEVEALLKIPPKSSAAAKPSTGPRNFATGASRTPKQTAASQKRAASRPRTSS